MRTHYSAMQVHATDPAYVASDDSHARFRAAALVSVMFVAALAFVHVISWALGLDLQRFGVHPRDVAGLAGIVVAPMLHGDVAHLASNALPLLIAGTALLYLYPDSSRTVLPAVYLGPGILVWLFGRDSIHIGASGLVYGIVAYVFVGGILRRDRRAWAASILVAFFYGAMVWGVRVSVMGCPINVCSPRCFDVTFLRMPRCFTCGSSNTCLMLLIGPFATPAAAWSTSSGSAAAPSRCWRWTTSCACP